MFFKVSALILALKTITVLAADTTSTAPTTTTHQVAPTSGPAQFDWDACQTFIVDQCVQGTENNPQVEVLHKVKIDQCDFFCNSIYQGNCTFYIQDLRQDICEIWNIESDAYANDCIKHEGPANPSLTPDGKFPTECTGLHHNNGKCNVRLFFCIQCRFRITILYYFRVTDRGTACLRAT